MQARPVMAQDPETFEAMLEAVRRFVAERLRPLEAEVAERDEIPRAIADEMRALGLFGVSIPEEYGGLGMSMEEECRVFDALAHASVAFRSLVGTNNGIGSQALVMAGSEVQKREWLPRIASGEIVTSFALTEPEAGSDGGSVRTRATRDGEFWVLNGTKRYITNGDRAGLFTVMARSEAGVEGARGVSAFLVPADVAGVSVGRPERKMGQQGAHVCDVTFEDARIPQANLLGAEGEGFKLAMRVLDRGRLHIASVCTGLAERALEDAIAYARERVQFGRPIAEFQLVQAMIADSVTEVAASRALVAETARMRDRGERTTMGSAAAKLFASEMAGRVVDRAVQIFGGAGYVAEYGIERLYRDVRLFRIYEGTSQILQLVIAREAIGR